MQFKPMDSTLLTNGESKKCGTCHKFKPADAFHKAKFNSLGIAHECKDCARVRVRFAHFKRTYDLDERGYNAILESQGGACALCGKPSDQILRAGKESCLTVDHDHSTGEVRGLLCPPCNIFLHHFEDPQFGMKVESAVEYLRNPPARTAVPGTIALRENPK